MCLNPSRSVSLTPPGLSTHARCLAEGKPPRVEQYFWACEKSISRTLPSAFLTRCASRSYRNLHIRISSPIYQSCTRGALEKFSHSRFRKRPSSPSTPPRFAHFNLISAAKVFLRYFSIKPRKSSMISNWPSLLLKANPEI